MPEKEVKSSKKKIFCILDILTKYSDDRHSITTKDIIEFLGKDYGIQCERKSVYRDIETLCECGYIIEKTKRDGYCLAERKFEVAEIRMLNDAVFGSSFITQNKTKELSRKLMAGLSIYQSDQFKSQTYFDNRIKFTNEHILYIIDTIHTAIFKKKKITFDYYRKKIVNNKIKRVFSKRHTVSPYALIWSEDKYYLIGNYDKYDSLSHYRIDRMEHVTMIDEPSRSFEEVSEYKGNFDAGDYISRTFRMYSGTYETIDLICSNDIIEMIIDKFGESAFYMNIGQTKFRIKTKGYNSDGLAQWLMMFADKCYIVEPLSLRKAVIKRAEEILSVQNDRNFLED